jgi:hypothetical protein
MHVCAQEMTHKQQKMLHDLACMLAVTSNSVMQSHCDWTGCMQLSIWHCWESGTMQMLCSGDTAVFTVASMQLVQSPGGA